MKTPWTNETIVIVYLCENEKVWKTVFVCSYGVQVESFKQKYNFWKSRDIVPLNIIMIILRKCFFFLAVKNVLKL